MQLSNFRKPRVFLKNYLSANPELLGTYVNWGVKVVSVVVNPLASLLKHLLQVQGLDPNAEPGRKLKESFHQALKESFDRFHDHDFDDDFDFSFLNKKFEETRKQLHDLDLSKEDFTKLTNVGNLYATQALDVQQQTVPAGPTVITDPIPLDNLDAFLDSIEKGKPMDVEIATEAHKLNALIAKGSVQVLDLDELVKQGLSQKVVDYWNKHFNPPWCSEKKSQGIAEKLDDAFIHSGEESPLFYEPEYDLELKKIVLELMKLHQVEPAADTELDPEQLFARTERLKNLRETIRQHNSPGRPMTKSAKMSRVKAGTAKKALNKSTIKKGDRKIKLSEARRLAEELVARGLCDNNQDSIDAQVLEILSFNKSAFDALEKICLQQPIRE